MVKKAEDNRRLTEAHFKYFEEKVLPIDGGWLGVAGNWCDGEKVVDYLNKKTKTKPKLKSDSSFCIFLSNEK